MKKIKLNLLIFLILSSGLLYAEESNSKKVILLIGDGMGPSQLGLLKSAWDYGRKHNLVPDRISSYDQLLMQGSVSLISVKPAGYLVADSACAASSISTAEDCLPETMGLNQKGEKVENFSEFAKKNKITIGLVSDTRLTHATPAAFYGRTSARRDERLLAEQFVESEVDFAFSGGRDFFDESKKSPSLINKLLDKKYQFVSTSQELEKIKDTPAIGLFGKMQMPDALEENIDTTIPSLKLMTKKALEIFSTKNSFFLMIEAGLIDWAAHDNDAGLMLREMLKFEEVLYELLEFIKLNPDVTLMVTSDHETGGFSYSYKRFDNSQKRKGISFPEYKAKYNFIEEETLSLLFSQKVSFHKLSVEMKSLKYDPLKIKKLVSTKLGISLSKDFEKALGSLSSRDYSKIYAKQFSKKSMYYLDEESLDETIIGKYISDYQQVNWSTGSHTVPLIPFVVAGSILKNEYKKPLTLVDIGKLLRAQYAKSE